MSSKTSWNLLGGYVEFEMDNSHTNPGVNVNLYTSSPSEPNCGNDCYCDIQDGSTPAYWHSKSFQSCMEMDFIEANGKCSMATTWHTVTGGNGCDRGGCQAEAVLPATGVFTIRASFSEVGRLTTTLDGVEVGNYGQQPAQSDMDIVLQTMQTVGAVIESSQWVGWVPGGSCPSGGSLDDSRYEVHNLKVRGTVVQGPIPSSCDGPELLV